MAHRHYGATDFFKKGYISVYEQAKTPAQSRDFKQHKPNKTMKKTTMWMMALLLCWGCGPQRLLCLDNGTKTTA
jgi:hypothetical protein